MKLDLILYFIILTAIRITAYAEQFSSSLRRDRKFIIKSSIFTVFDTTLRQQRILKFQSLVTVPLTK